MSSSLYAAVLSGPAVGEVGDQVGATHGVDGDQPNTGLPLAAPATQPLIVATHGIPVARSITSHAVAHVTARATRHLNPSHAAAVVTVAFVPHHHFLTPVAIAHATAAHVAHNVFESIHFPH